MTDSEKIEKIKKTVLKGIKSRKKEKQLDIWWTFLEKNLTFPCEAIIQDSENFELEFEDIVQINKIDNYIDPYGVLVEIKKGRKKYIFPLCFLEIVEKESENYFITEAFLEWWCDKYR